MSLIEGNEEELTRLCEHQARRLEPFGSALTYEPFDGDRSILDVLVKFFPLKPGKRADAYLDLLEELDSVFSAACLSDRDIAIEYPYVLDTLEKRNLCASSSMIAGTIPFI